MAPGAFLTSTVQFYMTKSASHRRLRFGERNQHQCEELNPGLRVWKPLCCRNTSLVCIQLSYPQNKRAASVFPGRLCALRCYSPLGLRLLVQVRPVPRRPTFADARGIHEGCGAGEERHVEDSNTPSTGMYIVIFGILSRARRRASAGTLEARSATASRAPSCSGTSTRCCGRTG